MQVMYVSQICLLANMCFGLTCISQSEYVNLENEVRCLLKGVVFLVKSCIVVCDFFN